MRDFLITDKAFTVPVVKFNEAEYKVFLRGLYQGHSHWPIGAFWFSTPCYQRTKLAYKQQIKSLLREFKALFRAHDSHDGVRAANLLRHNMVASDFFAMKENYGRTKEYLERVLFLLKRLEPQLKAAVVQRFGVKLFACGPGVFTQAADTLHELQTQESIPWWVANVRKNILEGWQTRRFQENDIHIQLSLMRLADSYQWGIPTSKNLANFQDNPQNRFDLDFEDAMECVVDFEKEFRRAKIIDVAKVSFYALLAEYKDRKDLSPPDPTDPRKIKRMTDSYNAVKAILAPFLEKQIFELPSVFEVTEEGETRIRKEFLAELTGYCEILLEKEGFLVESAAIQKQQAESAALVQRIIEKNTPEAATILLAQLSETLDDLGRLLFFLPEDLVVKTLDLLGEKKLWSLCVCEYQVVGLLYQLSQNKAKALAKALGDDYLKALWFKLSPDLRHILREDKHPLVKAANRSQHAFYFDLIDNDIFPKLHQEKDRLMKKYGPQHQRIIILTEAIAQIESFRDSLEDRREPLDYEWFRGQLTRIIQQTLLNNPRLDKYQHWGQKLGMALLNALMILPAVLPGLIKYAVTGTFLFSLKGKSLEVAEQANNTVKQGFSL